RREAGVVKTSIKDLRSVGGFFFEEGPNLNRDKESQDDPQGTNCCGYGAGEVRRCSDVSTRRCNSESRQILSRFLVQHELATSEFRPGPILNWSIPSSLFLGRRSSFPGNLI